MKRGIVRLILLLEIVVLSSLVGCEDERPPPATMTILEAARTGNVGQVIAHVQWGGEVDVTDASGNTPLHLAVKNGHKRVVEVLLESGANVNAHDSQGWTPVRWALVDARSEITPILLAVPGAEQPPAKPTKKLWLAASAGDLDSVRAHLYWASPLDNADYPGEPPLFEACKEGQVDVVKMLLAHGANVDRPDGTDSAIHYVAYGPIGERVKTSLLARARILELLIEHSARVNARGKRGWTPLCTTALSGETELAAILLKHGADPSIANDAGLRPLGLAQEEGHDEIAAMLRAHAPR